MKKLGKVLWIAITVLAVLIFLLTSATAYTSPLHLPFATLLSIGYLPILALYIIVVTVWFLKNKRIAIVLILLLFAGYKNLSSTVGVNVFKSSWKEAKEKGTIRIMSWNVNRFGNPYTSKDSTNSIRQQMLRFIKEQQPDILCLQDFKMSEIVGTNQTYFVDNIGDILEAGKFQQFFYPFYYEYNGFNYCDKFGVAIFTKLPIIDTGSFSNEGQLQEEKTGFIDLQFESKRLRVFTSHLSSFSIWPKDNAGIKYLEGDSSKIKTRNIVSKLNYLGKLHAREAEVIKTHLNKSPFPVLFMGDLNSVPSSYVYHKLSNNLSDAFLTNDYGIGGTYNTIFPKLRIDVMLHSKSFKVVQFIRPANNLSDHYPIIADIRWKQ